MSSSLEDSKNESSERFPHLGMLMGLRKGGMLCQGWSQEPLSFLQWKKAFLPALKHFTLRNTCTLQIPRSKSHSRVPSKPLNIMAINPMVVTARASEGSETPAFFLQTSANVHTTYPQGSLQSVCMAIPKWNAMVPVKKKIWAGEPLMLFCSLLLDSKWSNPTFIMPIE